MTDDDGKFVASCRCTRGSIYITDMREPERSKKRAEALADEYDESLDQFLGDVAQATNRAINAAA